VTSAAQAEEFFFGHGADSCSRAAKSGVKLGTLREALLVLTSSGRLTLTRNRSEDYG
jgi:hypothetical protein